MTAVSPTGAISCFKCPCRASSLPFVLTVTTHLVSHSDVRPLASPVTIVLPVAGARVLRAGA